jgi:putative ABC transport system permease protein
MHLSRRFVMSLARDASYALRSFARTPVLMAAIVVTFALGVAANTTLFSIVDAVLLRPLTYSDPERLVQIHETMPKLGQIPAGAAEFEQWRIAARSFEQLSLLAVAPVIVTGGGSPQRLDAARVSASLFPMLGVQAALGRTFASQEEVPGHDHVVVLGDGLWRSRFAADPRIVGQTISLNDQPFVVIGVLPSDFHFPRLDHLFVMGIAGDRPQLWTPFAITDADRGENSFAALGRLKPGVTVAQAGAEITGIQQRFAQTITNGPALGADVVPLQQQIAGTTAETLTLLWSAVAIVLLIACGNIANLLLVRAAAQRTDLAIRGALGASGWDLLRHALIDSLVVAALGGAAGLLLAWWSLPLILRSAPATIPRLDEVGLDGRALVFAIALVTIAGLLMGILPGRRAIRTTLSDALRTAGRGATSNRRDRTIRNAMVGAQVGLTVVCLASTGLVVQSLLNVLRVDRGFERDRVIKIDMSLSPGRYPTGDTRIAFTRRTLTAVQNLPGVTAAGFTNKAPLSGISMNSVVVLEGTEEAAIPMPERPQADVRSVDPGYFTTLGIPLLAGRVFNAANPELPVAVVSRALANRAWPGQDPVGKRFRLTAQPNRLLQVIGVAADVHNLGLESPRSATVYLPYWQVLLGGTSFVVRTTNDPAAMTRTVTAAVAAIDPAVPIETVKPMTLVIAESVAGRRFQATVLMLFAGVAVILVAVGIFGVVAYGVAERSRELGIRLALGATPGRIQRMIFSQVLGIVGVGLLLGGPLAVAVGYGLRGALFAVSPVSLWMLSAVCALLLVVSSGAAWLPARRATALDPADTLRQG